jgi:hypothetical protein
LERGDYVMLCPYGENSNKNIVITLICKAVFFLRIWPLGERNEEKGEKTHKITLS